MPNDHRTHGHDVLHGLAKIRGGLRDRIPDVYEKFTALNQVVFQDGHPPTATKELMALAIAVADKCDGCIAAHARAAASAGATRSEVAEAIGVAFAMRGGPATVFGARAFDAFQGFAGPE